MEALYESDVPVPPPKQQIIAAAPGRCQPCYYVHQLAQLCARESAHGNLSLDDGRRIVQNFCGSCALGLVARPGEPTGPRDFCPNSLFMEPD